MMNARRGASGAREWAVHGVLSARVKGAELTRALVTWAGILLLAIANGAFREGVIRRFLSADAAHVLSTILLCLLVLGVAWLAIGWIRPAGRSEAWLVGGLWLVLTVAFEFLAGHYLFGRSWEYLLADYDILRGRIWVFVLITTAVAPAVAFRVARR